MNKSDDITNKGTISELLAKNLWNLSLQSALMDPFWKNFNYKGRPKHGNIINRFRSKKAILKEDFLFREFILIVLVEIARSIYKNINPIIGESLLARVIELLVDGYSNKQPPCWQMLYFFSRNEATKFFNDGLLLYLKQEPKAETETLVFVNRAKYVCGDDAMRELLVGTAWMFSNNIASLRTGLEKALTSKIINDKTPVTDPIFVEIAREVALLFR